MLAGLIVKYPAVGGKKADNLFSHLGIVTFYLYNN